jgi:hypothetical protein
MAILLTNAGRLEPGVNNLTISQIVVRRNIKYCNAPQAPACG